MAKYLIGLDFGTSQTKVCLFNEDSGIREFIKFDNGNYFLPSLIVKKPDNTFSYGMENESGVKYRYFKMSAAEDDDLIQITNEDLEGNLSCGTIDDYRKYSTDSQVKPEILVILFLTYIYLYVKEQKSKLSIQKIEGLLGKLAGNNSTARNTFSINLGIPTEWNNPKHIKRKIKFQSLLITSLELAGQFDNLTGYLQAEESDLLTIIANINNDKLSTLKSESEIERARLITHWLKEYKLSVFPESAAGVNYLLKTQRLANGSYATLDIGAGTSDIAIFEVLNNRLATFYCSESTAIASNDVYREYAKQIHSKENVTFDEIKAAENIIRSNQEINEDFYENARRNTRGFLNRKGIEFVIGKTFYRKYYIKLHQIDNALASEAKAKLNRSKIIVFGGGANFKGFCSGEYCFYLGSNLFGHLDKHFIAKPITDFVKQVEISDETEEVEKHINLLVLALGLTYGEDNDNSIPFLDASTQLQEIEERTSDDNRYFYYDLQEAAYK